MPTQPDCKYVKVHVFAYLYAVAVLAAPAIGNNIDRSALGGYGQRAWFGCWDALADPNDSAQERLEEKQKICVTAGSAPSALTMTVVIDGEVISEETIIADGSRQRVSDGGCDGWIRNVLSEDRRRIYLQSEATCTDGTPRRLTGASMIVSGNRWIDIHALQVDGAREVLIQRYRSTDAGIARLPGALPSRMHAARVAAAAPLTVNDVLEALRIVDPAVVEAMLLESESRFGINSDLLLRLDDANVPGEVIDLMVALSFPEYFNVESGGITRQPEVYYGGYWSPWYPYYGYGHYYHHRYAHHDEDRGGAVVRGRGYVRVQQTRQPTGGMGSLLRAGKAARGGVGAADGSTASAAGRGAASDSGFQSGNSTPTRPAVPKRP